MSFSEFLHKIFAAQSIRHLVRNNKRTSEIGMIVKQRQKYNILKKTLNDRIKGI